MDLVSGKIIEVVRGIEFIGSFAKTDVNEKF